MDRSAANTRAIVESMGGWWLATVRAISILSEYVGSHMTAERRLSGEPVYHGKEGDAEAQEAVYTGDPEEWKQAGGKRIVAGRIIQHAEAITGADWSIVTLGLHDNAVDRNLAATAPAKRMAEKLNLPFRYVFAVCERWGEKRFMRRHKGEVSREYRIEYTYTVDDLINTSGWAEQKERIKRGEIIEILNFSFNAAKKRLDDA